MTNCNSISYCILFRMASSCWKKCVTRYSDSEVTEGEGSCTDRCVKKYFDVQTRVGKICKGCRTANGGQQQ